LTKRTGLGAFTTAIILGAIACTGSTGPQGASGAPGSPGEPGPAGTGTPSVSAVTPASAFLARTADVQIVGNGTSWSASTTVDFGAGITVNKVQAASVTGLVANITIQDTATTGPRDVTVNDGSTKETYSQAFTILAPATEAVSGLVAQGSIQTVHFVDVDIATPFDATNMSSLFGNDFTNVSFTTPSGVSAEVSNVTDYTADAVFLVDVKAPAGKGDVTLVSGPAMDASDVNFPFPASVDVAARTPTALASGTMATGNTKNPSDTALYSFTPATAAVTILDFAASSTSSTVTPGFALLPKSGAFADLLAFVSQPSTLTMLNTATDPYYLVYWDNTGATGPFSIGVTSTTPATTAGSATDESALPAMPSGPPAAAQTITALPFVLTTGTLTAPAMATSPANADWFQYTVTAADVGKSLHIQILGDANTDAVVSVFASNGITVVGEAAPTDASLEDTTFGPLAAGINYIAVSTGAQFDNADATYSMAVRIQ